MGDKLADDGVEKVKGWVREEKEKPREKGELNLTHNCGMI